MLPDKKPANQEEGAAFAPIAMELAGRLPIIKELHQKLWFETNRNSEWEMCATRYDDLTDQLRMFARNVPLRKYYL